MSNRSVMPAYRIETPRLVIRCWQPADAPLLKEAIDSSLDYLRPWMPWAHREPTPVDEKVALLRQFRGEFDLGRNFVYGIFNQDETAVLGGTGLHPRVGVQGIEIGYWIRASAAGQGLATESAAALTHAAFSAHAVDRVEIHCDPRNGASAAVARKLSYVHEAMLRRRVPGVDGQLRDSMIWVLFRDRFPSSAAARFEVTLRDVIGRFIPKFDGNA